MTKLSSGLFTLLIAALIIVTIAGPSFSAAQITSARSMPVSASPGTSFTVTLNIDVDESNPPSALTVNEKVPSGLTVGEANPPFFNNAGGSLLWIITPSQPGGKISDQTITYSLTGTAPGAYAFNGNVFAGSNSVSTDGSITIKIKDSCTENWSCGGWSACQDGAQERTCTDSSNCQLPESRPAISQECTVAAPSPQVQDNSGDQSGDNDNNNNISGNDTAGNDTFGNDTTGNYVPDSADNAPDGSTFDQSGTASEDDGSLDAGDDTQENITSQIEDKENKTGEDQITGNALDTPASLNASGSSFSEVSADNAASEETSSQGESSIPIFTIALAVILAAEIAILGMKRLNLIGTS